VDVVDQDGDLQAAFPGLGLDGGDLLLVSVHEEHALADLLRIPAAGLVERGRDHVLDALGDRRRYPFVPCLRAGVRLAAGGRGGDVLRLGFAKDGTASPCVAGQYSGTLGRVGNCQVAVSVHLVNERASCAADWRLFCPQSWDDAALSDPVAAAGASPGVSALASPMRCATRRSGGWRWR
jgi:hypothetical protein